MGTWADHRNGSLESRGSAEHGHTGWLDVVDMVDMHVVRAQLPSTECLMFTRDNTYYYMSAFRCPPDLHKGVILWSESCYMPFGILDSMTLAASLTPRLHVIRDRYTV